MLIPTPSETCLTAEPTPAFLIIEPKAPPAEVMRITSPAVSNGFAKVSPSSLKRMPLLCFSSHIESKAPISKAMFLSPMKSIKLRSTDVSPAAGMPPKIFHIDEMPISPMGIKIGSNEAKNEGALPFCASLGFSNETRNGIVTRAFIHLAMKYPAPEGMMPTSMLTRMEKPASIFKASTIAIGPGCGTVRQCGITPPEQMHRM
jgi:hypothetical protein